MRVITFLHVAWSQEAPLSRMLAVDDLGAGNAVRNFVHHTMIRKVASAYKVRRIITTHVAKKKMASQRIPIVLAATIRIARNDGKV
jgi:hypothetical protein